MSLYFGVPTTSTTDRSVSASVANRGLSLIKTKPSEISIVTFVASVQPAYASYIANLPHFMYATAKGEDCLIGTGCAVLQVFGSLLPMTVPPLIYDYDTKLNERQTGVLLNHSTIVTDGRSKNQTFVMQEPTREKIKSLLGATVKPRLITRHVYGTVNIDAMKVVFTLNSLFSGVLLTHAYPAFRTRDDLNPVLERSTLSSPVKKRKITETSYLKCASQPGKHTEDPGEMEQMHLETTDQLPTSMIRLHIAKPTLDNTPKWGPAHHLPNADGLFFPYVRDLSVADSVTVPTFVTNYVAKCLGQNLSSVVDQLRQVKSAWGLITNTEFGHELSHVVKCLETAIRCQAAIYPIYSNNIYEGTVVWGSGFTIGLHDKLYRPMPYADLQKVVSKTSMHSSAIQKIKELVGHEVDDEIDDCVSIRELSQVLQERSLDTIGRKEVTNAAHQLCYTNKYWSTNQRYLKLALHMFISWTKHSDIDKDIPMHPSMIFSIDREEVILSAFGHQAPSFMIPNGRIIKLGSDLPPPPHFHVSTVGLNRAVQDMKFVSENGYITNNNTNLAAKHKDSALNGEPKKVVWNMLSEAFAAGAQPNVTTTGTDGTAEVTGGALDFEW